MAWVTKEQIERARKVLVLDYVISNDLGSVKRIGSGYRDKEHPSIAINSDGWYWHTQEIGGKTALDYLVTVRKYGFVDAVCKINGEKAAERAVLKDNAPSERDANEHERQFIYSSARLQSKPFKPPPRNVNNIRAIAYLQSRRIAKPLILDCIKRGSIYESAKYHNCVFVGRDENDKARFAVMRGTFSNYKCDAQGSEKKYGFILPPSNFKSNAAAVFESPIDALSHQTLCEQGFIPQFDGWRLSLGGTSTIALTHFLEQRPHLTNCLVCTDNDEAGNRAAAKIKGMPGIAVGRSPPPQGKDWNETLMALQKAERIQDRARQDNTPYL